MYPHNQSAYATVRHSRGPDSDRAPSRITLFNSLSDEQIVKIPQLADEQAALCAAHVLARRRLDQEVHASFPDDLAVDEREVGVRALLDQDDALVLQLVFDELGDASGEERDGAAACHDPSKRFEKPAPVTGLDLGRDDDDLAARALDVVVEPFGEPRLVVDRRLDAASRAGNQPAIRLASTPKPKARAASPASSAAASVVVAK